MQKPRYTKDDVRRFSLPYVRAAESQHPNYLTERFAQYRALQEARGTAEVTFHKDLNRAICECVAKMQEGVGNQATNERPSVDDVIKALRDSPSYL